MRKTCEQCGQGFDTERSDSRFCGSACRARSWRARSELAGGGAVGSPLVSLLPSRSKSNTPPGRRDEPPPVPGSVPGTVPGPDRRAVPEPLPRRAGALVERVRRDLDAAGVLDSWEAAAALDVAGSLELGGSGSARAALHRELRAIMGDALRGTNDTTTSIGRYRDELEERRRRREERAGGG